MLSQTTSHQETTHTPLRMLIVQGEGGGEGRRIKSISSYQKNLFHLAVANKHAMYDVGMVKRQRVPGVCGPVHMSASPPPFLPASLLSGPRPITPRRPRGRGRQGDCQHPWRLRPDGPGRNCYWPPDYNVQRSIRRYIIHGWCISPGFAFFSTPGLLMAIGIGVVVGVMLGFGFLIGAFLCRGR